MLRQLAEKSNLAGVKCFSRMAFKEQWKEYPRHRNWLLVAVLGFLVVLPLADYMGHRVLDSEAVFASLDGCFWRVLLPAYVLALS